MRKSLFFFSLSFIATICLAPKSTWADEGSQAYAFASKSQSCPDAGSGRDAFLKWLSCEEKRAGLRSPSENSPALLPGGTPDLMDKTFIDTVLPPVTNQPAVTDRKAESPEKHSVNRQLAGQAWLDLDDRCRPPLLYPCS